MTASPYVYIAGRYGDSDGYISIEFRINQARAHAARLALAGIPYYSPHLNSAHFEAVVPDVPVSFWHKQNACFLPGAAALLIIKGQGWAQSAGTKAEYDEATRRGIPVYFTDTIDELIEVWPTISARSGLR